MNAPYNVHSWVSGGTGGKEWDIVTERVKHGNFGFCSMWAMGESGWVGYGK